MTCVKAVAVVAVASVDRRSAHAHCPFGALDDSMNLALTVSSVVS